MAGRGGQLDDSGRFSGLVYLPVTAENDFVPALPTQHVDLIYLCYPNNPTGTVATRETLARWVDYAKQNGAIILFDAAYEAYIGTPGIPHSIFEIPGARDVAIEFRSFSKTAGFTGARCAFTVVPTSLARRRGRRARRSSCTDSGADGTRPSSTAPRTWSNAGPRLVIRRRANSSSDR